MTALSSRCPPPNAPSRRAPSSPISPTTTRETTTNLYALTEQERIDAQIDVLPTSLSEAIDIMEHSQLVADALGEHVFEWFIRNKRAEWRDYKAHITQFELDRYYRNL